MGAARHAEGSEAGMAEGAKAGMEARAEAETGVKEAEGGPTHAAVVAGTAAGTARRMRQRNMIREAGIST